MRVRLRVCARVCVSVWVCVSQLNIHDKLEHFLPNVSSWNAVLEWSLLKNSIPARNVWKKVCSNRQIGIDFFTQYVHISLTCDSWLLLTCRHSHHNVKKYQPSGKHDNVCTHACVCVCVCACVLCACMCVLCVCVFVCTRMRVRIGACIRIHVGVQERM